MFVVCVLVIAFLSLSVSFFENYILYSQGIKHWLFRLPRSRSSHPWHYVSVVCTLDIQYISPFSSYMLIILFQGKMPSTRCAAVGCYNSKKKLKVWDQQMCEEQKFIRCWCVRSRPCEMFTFPAKLRDIDGGNRWLAVLGRELFEANRTQTPKYKDRLRPEHFVDKQLPLNLGYDRNGIKVRQVHVCHTDKKGN